MNMLDRYEREYEMDRTRDAMSAVDWDGLDVRAKLTDPERGEVEVMVWGRPAYVYAEDVCGTDHGRLGLADLAGAAERGEEAALGFLDGDLSWEAFCDATDSHLFGAETYHGWDWRILVSDHGMDGEAEAKEHIARYALTKSVVAGAVYEEMGVAA